MAAVKNKNTAPELGVRKALFALGFRYRLHGKDLPGTPDLVFPKYKSVIFIHGCFWHGHACKAGRLPATNIEFWREKLEGNAERDKKNQEALEKLGWRVKIIASCELKNKREFRSERQLLEVADWIRAGVFRKD